MRKLIVIVTLFYAVIAAAMAGFLSDWFRYPVPWTDTMFLPFLLGAPVVLVVAVVAYRQFNEWLVLALILITLGSLAYVANVHHGRYGVWLPVSTSSEVESSGVAVLNAHGQSLRYRLELHNAGMPSHGEVLIVTRDGRDRSYRLPLFGDKQSGYVSAKSPSDWIVLRPTSSPDVVDAEIGHFLFVRKTFRVNLRTGIVDPVSVKNES